MFFPIGDVNLKKGTKPIMSYLFIALNVAVFLFQFSMPPAQQNLFILHYGSIPLEILHGQDLFTLITSIFLHGGWMHLIGNMMFLWVFADNIEATVGYLKFVAFYIGGGVVASLTHAMLSYDSTVPCVGASGAIAACLGAYLVMFPTSKIKLFVVFIFSSINVPAILFLGIWIAQQFLSGMGTLGATTSDTSGVAYWAHIGGFVFGVLGGFMFRSRAIELQRA
ncbi:MAG TPA: rhomboid family intramembrane serine protease [Chitinophagaceae bacterium]|nr:rhomboid family intramembrane serine protease [Chitinophagaceae bacterium]